MPQPPAPTFQILSQEPGKPWIVSYTQSNTPPNPQGVGYRFPIGTLCICTPGDGTQEPFVFVLKQFVSVYTGQPFPNPGSRWARLVDSFAQELVLIDQAGTPHSMTITTDGALYIDGSPYPNPV